MSRDVDPKNRSLGEAIMLQRKRRRLSQDALTERAELPAGSVSRFERGLRSPDVNQLQAIADVLEVDPGEILQLRRAIFESGPAAYARDRHGAFPDLSAELHDAMTKLLGEDARLERARLRFMHRLLQETLANERRRGADDESG